MKTTILCGVSGSGKSTLAKSIEGTVVSADDYFIGHDGVYNFNAKDIGEAHGQCLRKAVECLQAGGSIVVDNTNTTVAEIAPYAAIALAYGSELEILVLASDLESCLGRNVHGTPDHVVRAQHARLESLELPPYWNVKRLAP